MRDWLIVRLSTIQAGIMHSLAGELRTGGLGAIAITLAVTFGAAHALTPGHGESALVADCLGKEARVTKGIRTALAAAFRHVPSGLAAFVVLRLLFGLLPSVTGRPSFAFLLGYLLIVVAGFMLVIQSLRPTRSAHDGAHALTASAGFLPCPLTISVLGFAWTQANLVMVGAVLPSLALGISITIGIVTVLAIIARRRIGAAVAGKFPKIESGARVLQGAAGNHGDRDVHNRQTAVMVMALC